MNIHYRDKAITENARDVDDPVGQAIAALTSASRNLVKTIARALDEDPELIDRIAHEAESEIMRGVMNEASWVATLIETRMIANVALGRK